MGHGCLNYRLKFYDLRLSNGKYNKIRDNETFLYSESLIWRRTVKKITKYLQHLPKFQIMEYIKRG